MSAPLSARKRQNDLPSGAAQQHDQKRSKYEGSSCKLAAIAGATTFDAIVDCIFGLTSLQDVGVEFMAGKLYGRKFISTLTEADFQVIYGQVKTKCTVTSETDYMYNHGRFNNACLSVSEEGVVTAAVHTEGITSFDMETNLPFDIRVRVAKETPILPLPSSFDDDYHIKRAKTRFTVDSKDWVVNITDTTTTSGNKIYELSVKVKVASIIACADHRACSSLLGGVFVEVHNLLARIGYDSTQVFPDLKLERVVNPQLRNTLKTEFMKLVPGVHTQDRFPGSQPCALERSKIKVLQNGKYWVSEKSDGLRLMLFFIDGYAFFVDRKFDFFQLHKFSFIVDLFGRKGATLVDGEMVRHLRTGKLMFLLFDILALNGKTNLGQHGLLDRLNIITKQVIDPFRVACKACNMKDDSSRLPFSLCGKIFRNKNGIELLSEMIKMQDSGERLFIDERRCHRNDGLIFTLDGPYLPYSSSHLMKWKYADRLTIDFRFKILSDGRHSFTIGAGRNKETEVRDFDMSPENYDRLARDMRNTRNQREAIIECTFDSIKGQWCYQSLRPDKDLPNHLNTMENTKRIVMDNITMEELVYRVPREPREDDWEKIHPELFKPEEPQAVVSDKSPTVDLPATPIDSPIAYLSPSQSSQSPPTPTTPCTPLRTSSQMQQQKLATLTTPPPPMPMDPPISIPIPIPMPMPIPIPIEAPIAMETPIPIEVPIPMECPDINITSIFNFMPTTTFPPDLSDKLDDGSFDDSLLCGIPPLFDTDSSPTHLSPPTSPSAFFS